MSQFVWANNAGSTLLNAISNSALSLQVQSGAGAIFPTLSNTEQYFKATIWAANGSPSTGEIILVTAVSTDTFTILRGQEGTTAQAWAANSNIANLLTMGSINELAQVSNYAGNPNGAVAGVAANGNIPPTIVWDYTNNLWWVCNKTGSASIATWVSYAQLNGSSTQPFSVQNGTIAAQAVNLGQILSHGSNQNSSTSGTVISTSLTINPVPQNSYFDVDAILGSSGLISNLSITQTGGVTAFSYANTGGAGLGSNNIAVGKAQITAAAAADLVITASGTFTTSGTSANTNSIGLTYFRIPTP